MTQQTDVLDKMRSRLKLTAIRDQLESLLDEAGRRQMSLRELLGFLCEAEIARKDQRRITMGLSIAKFPCLRTLEGFDFEAQPSVDAGQVRDLAACRWVANRDSLLFLGPPWSRQDTPGNRVGPNRDRTGLLGVVHSGDDHGRLLGQGTRRRTSGGATGTLQQA
jgi:hypothetical protein